MKKLIKVLKEMSIEFNIINSKEVQISRKYIDFDLVSIINKHSVGMHEFDATFILYIK